MVPSPFFASASWMYNFWGAIPSPAFSAAGSREPSVHLLSAYFLGFSFLLISHSHLHLAYISLYSPTATCKMSSPVQRLKQVVTALTGGPSSENEQKPVDPNFNNSNALKFQAGIPRGLPVHHTPLNPVSFLLRSATIRPNRVAMVHPAKNASWTYAQWCV